MAKDKYNRDLVYGDTVLLVGEKPYRVATVYATHGDIVRVNYNNNFYDLASANTVRAKYNKDIESIPDEYAREIEANQVFLKYKEQ